MSDADVRLVRDGQIAALVEQHLQGFSDKRRRQVSARAKVALQEGNLDGPLAIQLWAEYVACDAFEADLRRLVRVGATAANRLPGESIPIDA